MTGKVKLISAGGGSVSLATPSTGSNRTLTLPDADVTIGATNSAGVLTTQGDTLYRDGSGIQRLAKGTASQVLTMNSGATAPEWAAAAGGGKVVKSAFQTYSTQDSSTSTSFVDTGLTIDYSPVAASNLVYVICMQQCYMGSSGNGDGRSQFQLLESSTVLALTQFESSSTGSASEIAGVETLVGKFAAAGTSAVTIKTQYKKVSGGTPYAQHGSRASNLFIIEIEP